jgi:hypothetical protein
MKKFIYLFVFMLLAFSLAADWDPGDGHKMHYPQLPDEFGYDVLMVDGLEKIGDDWQCSETGDICSIHFWISWREDMVDQIDYIIATIYDDLPSPPEPYSKPGNILWQDFFGQTFTNNPPNPGEFWIRESPYAGDQGWYDPGYPSPDYVGENDHAMYFQVNMACQPPCFAQTEGNVYWLVLEIGVQGEGHVGWKTSQDAFNDDAVFWANPLGDWYPLTHASLHSPYDFKTDLAFVVNGASEEYPCPVELSSFTAEYSADALNVLWTTQSETNNNGWNLYRSDTYEIADGIQINDNIVPGQGSTSEPTYYTYTDDCEIMEGETYYYWIESVDQAGVTDLFGPTAVNIPIQEQDDNNPPVPTNEIVFNYPNPFNPETSIGYNLENPENATIEIFNTKGQLVQTFKDLCNENSCVVWDGNDYTGNPVSSGIYFYKLNTNEGDHIRKMILAK